MPASTAGFQAMEGSTCQLQDSGREEGAGQKWLIPQHLQCGTISQYEVQKVSTGGNLVKYTTNETQNDMNHTQTELDVRLPLKNQPKGTAEERFQACLS